MRARLRVMCLGLGILSTVMACVVTPPSTPPPSDIPPSVAPPPYLPPPSTTGTRRPDISQPSPYERKMDEEEIEYRRRRSAQEQEQEQRYQQWEQERARERDPRYEWMR
jgi:hypothetical protein